jgi:alpha-galactosidase/6-phospho-beta-glucosidase family protein
MKCLTAFISGYRAHVLSATMLPPLVKAYEDAMQAELAGKFHDRCDQRQ